MRKDSSPELVNVRGSERGPVAGLSRRGMEDGGLKMQSLGAWGALRLNPMGWKVPRPGKLLFLLYLNVGVAPDMGSRYTIGSRNSWPSVV